MTRRVSPGFEVGVTTRNIKIALLTLLLGACSHVDRGREVVDAGCRTARPDAGMTTLSIEVISDRHGDIGELPGCHDQQFGIDFSKSDLQSGSHAKLLENMGRSAYTDRAPVPMRVRGEFRRLENGDGLILLVSKILDPE
jgi:hypothetical protein